MNFRRFKNVLMILSAFCVVSSLADDTMNCPGECHCSLDGITVLVDCSGLQLTELPEFENTQVINKQLIKIITNCVSLLGSYIGFI